MTIYKKQGDGLIGNKIICEARQISSIKVINKSERHKSQRIILRDNTQCIIDRELKFIK